MSENVFEDKSLQSYLREIADIEPLSREKEKELALKAKKDDKKAINELVRSNLKFVVKIASRYQNRGLTLAELISEGNMGLIKSIEKFDPEKKNKLISYAVWWIKQRILFAIAEKTNVIRIPLGKANIANKVKIAKNKIFSETGKKASIKEISERTNLNEKAIRKIKNQDVDMISLEDASYTNKYDTVTLNSFLEDEKEIDPKTLYYRGKVKKSIEDSLNRLPDRDSYIVKEYFGLDSGKGKNFAQIGEELGLSRERVRQIQKKALEKILENTYPEMESDIDNLI